MNRFKIIVAYDGTDFQGWQSQPHGITVCDILQKTFKKAFGKEAIIIGASRTDSGVHALGQVALIKTELELPNDKILSVWSNALPDGILIRSLIFSTIPKFNNFLK